MAVLDTTLLVDLIRECKANRNGPATLKVADLLARNEALLVTTFTIGELFVGVVKGPNPAAERSAVENCLRLFKLIDFEESTARLFGGIVGHLELRGQTIGDMDALIGSVALERAQILVTRNARHFVRIPGLVVETY
jgi:tRNA(fMet)-specific endonuclease VapC